MEENFKDNKKQWGWVLALIGAILVVAGIVWLIYYLLQGETTVIITSEENVETTESITCSGSEVDYPALSDYEPDRKNLQINVIFGDNKIDTISLAYKLYYDDTSELEKTLSSVQVAMNDSFADDSLNYNALGATFSNLSDSLQVALFAKGKEINGVTGKYFLLDETNGKHNMDTLIKIYNNAGLECTMNK